MRWRFPVPRCAILLVLLLAGGPAGAGETGREGCDCLDLVFCLDITESMDSALWNSRDAILETLDLAETTCDSVHVGLITFYDWVWVRSSLTSDLDLIRDELQGLGTQMGWHYVEASNEALCEAVDGSAECSYQEFTPGLYRPECCRWIVLVADNKAGGCNDAFEDPEDVLRSYECAAAAGAAGIQLGILLVQNETTYPDAPSILQGMASRGAAGSRYFALDDQASDAASAMAECVESCAGPPPGTPTATPTPPDELGVRLSLPPHVSPGDAFWVHGYLDNPGELLESVPVFFILEVNDHYWFWPDWRWYHPPESESIDLEYLDVPYGVRMVEVIPLTSWPDTGEGAMEGVLFYGAMLNADWSAPLGSIAVQSFGYGPASVDQSAIPR